MVLLAQSWSLIYQFWIHTEKIRRLPRPLEAVLNTPSHHRVHHGANEVYLDRNYAGHPDHLGPPLRHLRARGRARPLRPHPEHPHLQAGQGRLPRVHRDVARHRASAWASATSSASSSAARAGPRRERPPKSSKRPGADGPVDVSLRPAEPADAERLAQIVEAAYSPYVERIGARPRPMDDDYDELVARGVLTVAERGGEPIGLVALEESEGRFEVDNLAVDPAHQGTGAGRALLEHAEAEALRVGLRRDPPLHARNDDREPLALRSDWVRRVRTPRRRCRQPGLHAEAASDWRLRSIHYTEFLHETVYFTYIRTPRSTSTEAIR